MVTPDEMEEARVTSQRIFQTMRGLISDGYSPETVVKALLIEGLGYFRDLFATEEQFSTVIKLFIDTLIESGIFKRK